eukprot:4007-Heterococcus_DN1.PRE.3
MCCRRSNNSVNSPPPTAPGILLLTEGKVFKHLNIHLHFVVLSQSITVQEPVARVSAYRSCVVIVLRHSVTRTEVRNRSLEHPGTELCHAISAATVVASFTACSSDWSSAPANAAANGHATQHWLRIKWYTVYRESVCTADYEHKVQYFKHSNTLTLYSTHTGVHYSTALTAAVVLMCNVVLYRSACCSCWLSTILYSAALLHQYCISSELYAASSMAAATVCKCDTPRGSILDRLQLLLQSASCTKSRHYTSCALTVLARTAERSSGNRSAHQAVICCDRRCNWCSSIFAAQFRLHVVHCVHYALATVEEFADAWQLQT